MGIKWGLILFASTLLGILWTPGVFADIFCNVVGEAGGPLARATMRGAGAFLNGTGLAFQMLAAVELRERSRAADIGQRAISEFGNAVEHFKGTTKETNDLRRADSRLEGLEVSVVAKRLEISPASPLFQEIASLAKQRNSRAILERCAAGSEQTTRGTAMILDIIRNRNPLPPELWRFERDLQRELTVGRIISGFFRP